MSHRNKLEQKLKAYKVAWDCDLIDIVNKKYKVI